MNSLPRLQSFVCVSSLLLVWGCHSASKQTSLPAPLTAVEDPATEVAITDNSESAPARDESAQARQVSNPTAESGTGSSSAVTSAANDETTSEVALTTYLDSPMTAEDSQTIPPAPVAPKITPIPDPGSGPGLTLDMFESIAATHNPAIAQASASAQKAQGFRNQVGRYPNPTIGYSGQQLADKGTDQHLGFVEQTFVSAHKLRLNERVLDHEVQSQLWEVEAQRYRVLTDIRQRFYQALAAQQRRDLAKNFQDVASEGVRIAEIRRQALEGSVPEVLQAEIQLNEVDLIRQRAEIAYQTTWSELISVAGVPGLAEQPLIGELRVDAPPRDWDTTYVELTQSNPALLAARSRVGRATANLTRQEVQAIPNLLANIQGGYDYGMNSSMMNVQMGIPLPIFNQNHGNISAAQAEYCRAAQDVRRIELQLRQRLAVAARQYDSAVITVERLENQILPKAHQTLTLSEKAYQAGEFGFLQVLVARRTYFDSNLQYNDALIQLAEAKWMIDGMLLDGGLQDTPDTQMDDGLRGQTLSGE
jgi:cobalt-zinc-cadmium efflux system outer membrane protein